MYRLTDDIARSRLLYSAPVVSAPHILLIDLPACHRGAGLLLQRYYSVILETEAEVEEMESWLARPREDAVPPSLFDKRASRVTGQGVLVARLNPVRAGWPWLVVCRWPASAAPHIQLARGCYSIEAFDTSQAMTRHCVTLLAALGQNRTLKLRMVSADALSPAGTA